MFCRVSEPLHFLAESPDVVAQGLTEFVAKPIQFLGVVCCHDLPTELLNATLQFGLHGGSTAIARNCRTYGKDRKFWSREFSVGRNCGRRRNHPKNRDAVAPGMTRKGLVATLRFFCQLLYAASTALR